MAMREAYEDRWAMELRVSASAYALAFHAPKRIEKEIKIQRPAQVSLEGKWW